ncbi:MAG: hypothetical protein Q7R31_03790 [Candidatus Levybacteria bacterium]|nr:hypothetical protein [Candidatus Levybacteria bacterium]
MTATGHAIIGTIIAAKIGNPALAVPIAIASHIAADALPHWDTATNIAKKGKERVIVESFFDLILGFALSYLLVIFLFPKTDLSYAFLIILVSQSLDWLMVPYRLFDINFPLFRWTYKFQKLFDSSLDAPWGIVTQVILLLLLIVAALKLF